MEPLLQHKGWLGRGLVADEDGVLQPYSLDGEMRPVKVYRDSQIGQLLVPDAGFHLNQGRGYLSGLGQSLLEKSAVAPPRRCIITDSAGGNQRQCAVAVAVAVAGDHLNRHRRRSFCRRLGRLVSAFRYPVTVLQREESLLLLEDLAGYSVVTLARSGDGFEPVSSVLWLLAAVAYARLIMRDLNVFKPGCATQR